MRSHRPSGLCALAVAILSLAAVPARADDNVGVVVTAEAMRQPQLVAQIETWLRMHGHEVVPTPLPPDAVSALIDCFVIEEPSCASGIVDKRAKSSTIVFAQAEQSSAASVQDRVLTLTVHWLDKGKTPRKRSKACGACNDNTMRSTADALMVALTGENEPRGRVKLRSQPAGAKVTVGDEAVGNTPSAHRLSPGEHKVVFELEGRPTQTRSIKVQAGQTLNLNVSFEPEAGVLRRKVGYASLAGGVALAVAGAIVFTFDEDQDPVTKVPQTQETYLDTAPHAIALLAGGAVAMGVGAYLILTKPKRSSVPAAALLPGGGVIGWAGRF